MCMCCFIESAWAPRETFRYRSGLPAAKKMNKEKIQYTKMKHFANIALKSERIVKHVIGAPRRYDRRRNIVWAAGGGGNKRRRPAVIDDPGGHKARLEAAFGRRPFIKPDDIVAIMMRRARRVHEVVLHVPAASGGGRGIMWHLRVLPHQIPAHVPGYMDKLQMICDAVNKWGVADVVRARLEQLDGPVVEPFDIDLTIGGRLLEFELDL